MEETKNKIEAELSVLKGLIGKAKESIDQGDWKGFDLCMRAAVCSSVNLKDLAYEAAREKVS